MALMRQTRTARRAKEVKVGRWMVLGLALLGTAWIYPELRRYLQIRSM